MKAEKTLAYVIVRSHRAGVFAGYLESRKGEEVILLNSRRLWYWDGACSLSQLANEGVKKPTTCKFAQVVGRMEILGVIEMLYATEAARKNLSEVPIWQS